MKDHSVTVTLNYPISHEFGISGRHSKIPNFYAKSGHENFQNFPKFPIFRSAEFMRNREHKFFCNKNLWSNIH